ncbi:hypothetical protein QBC34DRAFT_440502 [Podospora aff. communis PSN243]|uniref:Uncharacterized protein n=1 Tax=Podospora aff. communis PSN243 TaxID=3040156 RepID=A0AAV9GFU1_9PEZI|nr:hypothetical protein QBC34DRAFT_440502 [Podospora aff. communis PSN243]
MDSKTSLVVAGDNVNRRNDHEGVTDINVAMASPDNDQNSVNATPQQVKPIPLSVTLKNSPTAAQLTDAQLTTLRTTYCKATAALLATINVLRDELTALIIHGNSSSPSSTSEGHAIVLRHKLDVQAHLITTREHSHFAGTESADFITFQTRRLYKQLAAVLEEEIKSGRAGEEAHVGEEAKRVLEFRRTLVGMSEEEVEELRKREGEMVEKAEREEKAVRIAELVKRREAVVVEGERCKRLFRELVAGEGGGEVLDSRERDGLVRNEEAGKEDCAVMVAAERSGEARLPRQDATIYRGWEQAYEERVLGLPGRKVEIEAFEVASVDGGRRKLALGCRSLTCIAVYLILVGIVAVGGILALLKAT